MKNYKTGSAALIIFLIILVLAAGATWYLSQNSPNPSRTDLDVKLPVTTAPPGFIPPTSPPPTSDNSFKTAPVTTDETINNKFKFTYPIAGEIFAVGQKVDIKWTTGDINKKSGGLLNLLVEGKIVPDIGGKGVSGIQVDFSSGHYLWIVPNVSGGNSSYQLQLHAISAGDPGFLRGEITSGAFSIK